MKTLVLENLTPKGERLSATFLPDHGMNLCSYRLGDIEIIDQSTKPLFEERFAGMGALIGPHFHRRNSKVLPKIASESHFPHIARVKANGVDDPFSHGIARYAPWTAEQTDKTIVARLKGKDEWNGVPLSDLQGQDFEITLTAKLEPSGLELKLTVTSDSDSLMGIHYYYALPPGKNRVKADVKKQYREGTEIKPIPDSWSFDDQNQLTFDLDQEADFGFHPYKNPCGSHIVLETEKYKLHTHYSCTCQENTWQLYHPAKSSFVCIEPMSAQDPRKPLLTVSSLDIKLSIEV